MCGDTNPLKILSGRRERRPSSVTVPDAPLVTTTTRAVAAVYSGSPGSRTWLTTRPLGISTKSSRFSVGAVTSACNGRLRKGETGLELRATLAAWGPRVRPGVATPSLPPEPQAASTSTSAPVRPTKSERVAAVPGRSSNVRSPQATAI